MNRILLIGCLAATLSCGTNPLPAPLDPVAVCGDATCTPGAESCSSCVTDCGECGTVCGDGTCNMPGETCGTCAEDCGECGTCGDGTCNASVESCTSCPADCSSCESCGDGVCIAGTESCGDCPADCGGCTSGGTCGDGTCSGETESCSECPQDCGECSSGSCGDGTCLAAEGEDCSSCAADCGACVHCGNGTCEVEEAETCASCAADCGACNPCGDDVCGAGETCSNCAADCGRCNPCGDGVCREATENCTSCPADCGACNVRKGCMQGKFSAFHGNLHSHTSYSDGALTPAAAFLHAKRAGLDFMHVTDHKGQMSDGQWDACKTQANANNSATFVTGCGYEIVINQVGGGADLGHINFLFPSRRTISPVGLDALYKTLVNCEACIGMWNHPPWPGTFGDYRFFPSAKPQMRLIEFSGRGEWSAKMNAYFTSLRNGWKISPAMNEDNHMQNWGDSKRATGVWAAELTRAALREAIESNRTFATEDDTASVAFKADENCWMGSVLHGFGAIDLTAVARDRQDADKFRRIELRGPNGGVMESKACNGSNPCTAKFTRHPSAAMFWVVTAVQEDGDTLVSAPIWIER